MGGGASRGEVLLTPAGVQPRVELWALGGLLVRAGAQGGLQEEVGTGSGSGNAHVMKLPGCGTGVYFGLFHS